MNNLWLVQTSGFNSKYIEQTIGSLKKLDFEFRDFGVIGEKRIITNLNDIAQEDTRYISRGGVMMLDILNEVGTLKECASYIDPENDTKEFLEGLRGSIDYSQDGFDQNVYKEYGLPLLNENAVYHTCKDIIDNKFDRDMFIKPSKDLKHFNGGVIKAGDSVGDYIRSSFYRKGFDEEVVLLSPTVQIYSEYRFFVIDGRVITGSLYKRGEDIFPDSFVPEYMLEKAQEYAKIYQPAEIFVMDLADTEKGIKIVEYNCWNCSGLYHVDSQKLFFEVNEYKKK